MLKLVSNTFDQLLTVSDDAFSIARNQTQITIGIFYNLSKSVAIPGPIPAVIEVVTYWLVELQKNLKSLAYKVKATYGSILNRLHYQLIQLTQCSANDLNQLINGFALQLERDTISILRHSNQKIGSIIKAGTKTVTKLNRKALKGCGKNLEKLYEKRTTNLLSSIGKMYMEFQQRHEKIRSITIALLNSLYERIKHQLT